MPEFAALRRTGRSQRHSQRGQSMVELALVLPVLLLLLLIVVDFGRVYLGYINLQQMTRVAAGFAAENATAWQNPDSPEKAAIRDRYQQMIENDATTINCDPQRDLSDNFPGPGFIDLNFALGSRVQVAISCQFSVLTPVISSVVGDQILLSASIVYPIREGIVAEVPGGGAPVLVAPVADFLATPRSGYEPLDVTFTDTSRNSPNSWTWNFGDGSAFTEGPHTRTYDCPDTVPAGGSCTFNVSLQVGSSGGFDTETRNDYITVYVPPETGPIAEFEATPLSGLTPLNVSFDFVDIRADQGTPIVYTDFQWDFENDGTIDAFGPTEISPSHTYTGEGAYDVRLVVTDGATTHELVKEDYIIVSRQVCTVPDFAGVRRNSAQQRWAAANFTTDVQFMPGNGNYVIRQQSLLGGLVDPQPDGCNSNISVGP